MENENADYSGLMSRIKDTFTHYSEGEAYKALFVYADLWGRGPYFVPVPNQDNLWPWAVFDAHPLVQHENVEKPLMAFDLKRTFEDQIPAHLRQIQVFDCFQMNPLINIPDRAGIIPADKQREFQQQALQERPARPSHLRLVKS